MEKPIVLLLCQSDGGRAANAVPRSQIPVWGYTHVLHNIQASDVLTLVSSQQHSQVGRVQLLGNATRALDFGEYRQAFIEVMSALELVIARRLNTTSEIAKRAVQSFLARETQSAQVAVVLLATGANKVGIEEAIQALKVRNRGRPRGISPVGSRGDRAGNVMKTIQRLAGLEEIKSPVLTLNNMLSAP
ncbi:MAG: hypothetical protein M3O41_13320 [Pseudomonadota bacterium]|nr:hypothetical protein [Pseudomonadota bacterium]